MKIFELFEDKDTLELPDIKVGDEVKIGRFKNRKAIVKGFKKDKKDNHPILKTTKGDTKLFKPRISKLEEETIDQENLTIFIQKVHNDCQPFLSRKSHGINLVRGIDIHFNDPFLYNKKIHSNRQRNSNLKYIEQNKALSKLMQKDGFIATRSNGVFCFGAKGESFPRGESLLHGKPYVIFPVGQFDMTWYNRREMFAQSTDIGSGGWYQSMWRGQIFSKKSIEEVAEKFWDKYKHAFEHGTDVDKAIDAESEIIVAGSTYHAIEADFYFENDIDYMIRTYK